MYKINYRTKQVYTDEAVRKFKNLAVRYIPPITYPIETKLKVEVEYHGQFHNKSDNKIKRRDGQNLDKCLYDVVFEKIGIDDKHAWEGTWKKVHNSEEEFTLVTITKLEE